jgi:hypothetical protein
VGILLLFHGLAKKQLLILGKGAICGKSRKRVRWKTIGYVQRNAHCINPKALEYKRMATKHDTETLWSGKR